MKNRNLINKSEIVNKLRIEGATPPGIFVGRIGYPKVYVGPMIPPFYDDTEILDHPESWIGKSLDEIINYRFSLVRGKIQSNVYDVQEESGLLETLKEISIASTPVNSEAIFSKNPDMAMVLNNDIQPFGPSAPLSSFQTQNFRVDKRLEKAYYDHDLPAVEAVLDLYFKGLSVTRIQRVFSLGMLGIKKKRKLVPSKWTITAIDDSISLALLKKVKRFDTIDKYRVYFFSNLDNKFVIIMSPERWKFEWIEAWFPGTVWNKKGIEPSIMGDYEPYSGRNSYAQVGGCYYSARLSIVEKLFQEQAQASSLILREIYPNYVLPVGVWNVRESIRSALKTKPEVFDSFSEAIDFAFNSLIIKSRKWFETSKTLNNQKFQRRIFDYF
jgi:hypothetical protein